MLQPDFQQIPLSQLRVSSTVSQIERRLHLDRNTLAELADSLLEVGMLQPLVVRYVDTKAVLPEYEIVAGERRFLAAKQAGLKTVPVNVRQLSDEQVLEVQLVENLQREDLHELAEAEGYEGLQKLGHTAEQIADKVGKSKAYVYARLKLTSLAPEARKAFYAGKLNSSTALLLARIPSDVLQKQALKEITAARWDDGVMSVRDTQRHIHEHYMLKLSAAGFKTEDPNLVPAAGACGACLKRTGNQPQLFGDVKGADVCTDPVCFKAKIAAHASQMIATAEKSGQRVIAGDQAKKIARYGTHSLQGYVRLDSKDYDGPKVRTYRQVLGKGYVSTLLVDPEDGKVIEVAPDKDLPKGKSSSDHDSYRAQNKANDKKRQLELEYRAALAKQIHTADFDDDTPEDLALACEAIFDRIHHDGTKRLFKVMGWEPVQKVTKKGSYKMPPSYEISAHLEGLDETGLWKMLRLLSIAGELEVYSHDASAPERMLALAKRLKVNAQKVRDELVAAAKVKTAAKKTTKRSKAK
jgi:ParB/RepB/Spo0J family partition protein